jgi:cation:H+ antiporter
MPGFGTWPVWANAAVFLASAAVVWTAGSRLAGYVDAISDRTGIGQGFAGLVLLGGITSLPEVAVSVTSSLSGEEVMAVNNLLGAVAVQVTILAFADMLIGRDALTSVVTHPIVLLQATLGITMLAFIAMAVTAGDVAVGPVGLWSTFLIVAYLGGVALLARYEKGPETWTAQEGPLPDPADAQDTPQDNRSLPWLVASTAVAAAFILVAGWALSQSGAAAAAQTGLGSAFFGATILAVATSLPEISTVFAAVRLRRYEMALGDIFGTNLFNAALIFVIDLLAPGDPVLGRVGAFSAFGALLGLVLTAIFMAGVIERRDRTVLRMGWDSLAALVVYAAGVAVLFALRGQTDGG